MKNTPENITALKPNQILVFGSNTEGRHGLGVAKLAMQFGAVYCRAAGRQGQTYAIVTKDLSKGSRSVPLHNIKIQIENLIMYAMAHPELEFLVTKIGCGLGGYTVEEIAELFRDLIIPANVLLPLDFINYLNNG